MSKTIGNGFITYADSTLMTLNKKELIHVIRVLEQNLRNAEEVNNRQYKLLMKAMDYSCGIAPYCSNVCEVE